MYLLLVIFNNKLNSKYRFIHIFFFYYRLLNYLKFFLIKNKINKQYRFLE